MSHERDGEEFKMTEFFATMSLNVENQIRDGLFLFDRTSSSSTPFLRICREIE